MGLGKILSGLFTKDEENTGDKNRGEEANSHTGEDERHNAAPPETAAGHASEARTTAGSPEDGSEPPASDKAGGGGAPVSSEGSSELSEGKILEVLSNVYDPEIPIDIVNLGLIYGIDIDGGNVHLSMTMTAPGCPASAQIAGESKILIEEIPGVESVDIEIVWDPPWDPSKMSEEARQSMNMF